MHLSRRLFLQGAGSLSLASAMPPLAWASGGPTTLRLESRQIEVNGKAATRYGIRGPSGTFGLILNEGDDFDVVVENALPVPSLIHWHGLTEPWRMDGVPYLSRPPIGPGGSAPFRFPAVPPGTRWMHSHFGLQEQDLLAAPLIIREKSALASDAQEVVIFLEDFSWTDPETLFANLRKPGGMAMPGGTAMAGGAGTSHAMNMSGGTDMSGGTPMASGGGMAGGMKMAPAADAKSGTDTSTGPAPDLNDVHYDAFLGNDRTLDDPEIVDVDPNAEVRLRIINAASASNFTIDLGGLEGRLVTVDGNPIVPMTVRQVPLAIAQRVDIVVQVPAGSAAPIFAIGEGRNLRAGIILRPKGAAVSKLAAETAAAGPVIGLDLEAMLVAGQPLPSRPVDNSIPVDLTGNMGSYVWGMSINDQGGMPAIIDKGQRVELVMRNRTMMAHPMHLHGHVFQVTGINGKQFTGAVRDSVLVPPNATVNVVFDADNPGLWAFHCHNLYHMAAGMFATVAYRSFS